jgi:hypothetical protein
MALPAIAAAVKMANVLFFHMVFPFPAGPAFDAFPNLRALNLSRAA